MPHYIEPCSLYWLLLVVFDFAGIKDSAFEHIASYCLGQDFILLSILGDTMFEIGFIKEMRTT